MTTLILVRHGETAWNVERRYQGQTDIPLNDKGRQQAHDLRQRLISEAFDVIYSSDLTRALETAQIALGERQTAIKTDVRLREAGFGLFEGLTFDEIKHEYPEMAQRWYEDRNNAPEGAETLDAFTQRIQTVLDDLRQKHSGQRVLIVAHGGSISMLAALALGVAPSARWQFRLNNASLSRMTLYDTGTYFELWNDTHHLTT